jgi:hypothetical protein
MAHYAKVLNGLVVNVIVADPEFLAVYVDDSPGDYIQTSYRTIGGVHYGEDGLPDGGIALRKNFAGIGYSYDRERDAFIPPKPFASWLLNEETCLWDAPVPYPQDGKRYAWDEADQVWVEVVNPAL